MPLAVRVATSVIILPRAVRGRYQCEYPQGACAVATSVILPRAVRVATSVLIPLAVRVATNVMTPASGVLGGRPCDTDARAMVARARRPRARRRPLASIFRAVFVTVVVLFVVIRTHRWRAHARSRASATGEDARARATEARANAWSYVDGRDDERCGVGGMAFGKKQWECASERSYGELDVVSAGVKPSCVNAAAVAALNQYVGPRRIIIVASGGKQCALYRKMASNVECHEQDAFVEGITKAETSKVLERLYPSIGFEGGATSEFVGRELGGWYLQQLIKLGASNSSAVKNPPLSRKFLIWDLDMIPLRRLDLFRVDPESKVVRAVREIGGNVIKSYEGSYAKLMKNREHMTYSPDGSSYVTHQMVVDGDIMEEMLVTFAESATPDAETTLPAWALAILQSLDEKNLNLSFSEYGSYASYVAKHYPNMVEVEPRKNWARASGGKLGISLQRWINRDGLCCPGPQVLNLMRSRRFRYVGHEIGHVASCEYNSPAHAISYGYHGSTLRASMYANVEMD